MASSLLKAVCLNDPAVIDGGLYQCIGSFCGHHDEAALSLDESLVLCQGFDRSCINGQADQAVSIEVKRYLGSCTKSGAASGC